MKKAIKRSKSFEFLNLAWVVSSFAGKLNSNVLWRIETLFYKIE